MKNLNYLLILIAIAAITVSFIVIEANNKLVALSTAFVCIAASFDRGIYRIPFLVVALMLLAASYMYAGYVIRRIWLMG